MPDRSVWTGSQSLGGNALHSNDESLLHLSVASSVGRSTAATSGAFEAFTRQWSAISARATTCHQATDPELAGIADSLTADPDDNVMPQ